MDDDISKNKTEQLETIIMKIKPGSRVGSERRQYRTELGLSFRPIQNSTTCVYADAQTELSMSTAGTVKCKVCP